MLKIFSKPSQSVSFRNIILISISTLKNIKGFSSIQPSFFPQLHFTRFGFRNSFVHEFLCFASNVTDPLALHGHWHRPLKIISVNLVSSIYVPSWHHSCLLISAEAELSYLWHLRWKMKQNRTQLIPNSASL